MRKKLRYDLTPPYAIEQLAEVMTYGSEKHGDRTWENGRKWSDVLACAERHINAIKRGEDFDKETGLLHSSMAMTQLAFLTEYYKIYPQGDDRRHRFLKPPKIGLDIDEVLADWLGAWSERFGIVDPILFWNFDAKIKEKFNEMKDDKDFWVNIRPKINPKDLPFEPTCYITSRSIPQEWTEEWIDKHNFPRVPVYSIGFNQSKVEVAKKAGIDWFVDDRYENFVELNNAGICTFLMDCEHNRRYDVGFKRIKSLKELVI
jgi:uncharacterized HAD superfamily protein